MKKYARVYDNMIYAIDVNVDINNLTDNSKEVDFNEDLINEINNNVNYTLHDIDGNVINERMELYKELENIYEDMNNIDYPNQEQIALATYRASRNKTTKSDEVLFTKLDLMDKKQSRIKEIEDIIRVNLESEVL